MKLLVCLGMLAIVFQAKADDPKEDRLPAFSVGRFPLAEQRLTVSAMQGTLTLQANHAQALKGGFPNLDYPPSTHLKFEGQHGSHPLRQSLDIYQITRVQQAPYVSIQPIIEQLRKLLGERSAGPLDKLAVPIFPFYNAANTIQLKTRYFDADWGSGIFVLTSFASGNGEYPANNDLVYLFQGLSKDGNYYVSGAFNVSHPRLDQPDYTRLLRSDDWDRILARAREIIPSLPDATFHPRLDAIRTWLGTLKMERRFSN